MGGYVIFSMIMCAIIYPIVVSQTWGGGFLAEKGFVDFAGSGVVHLCGGVGALVGAIIVGPREGRFNRTEAHAFATPHPQSVVLGTFLLWFGWYGFNPGSTGGIADAVAARTAALAAVNTTLGGSGGGVVVLLLQFF